MDQARKGLKVLDEASRKQEKEIVVQLGTDRALSFVGVYLMLVLAGAAKIAEVASSNLSCHSMSNMSLPTGFIEYSKSYCWETSRVTLTKTRHLCKFHANQEQSFMKNPDRYKIFIKALPYLMFLEAAFLVLPGVTWHMRVGSRLMGNLLFMQQLLGNVYKIVKKIPTGIYRRDDAFDRRSYYLDGWSLYDEGYKLESFRTRKKKDETPKSDEEDDASTSPLLGTEEESMDETKKKDTKESYFSKLLFGNVRDRHLFSMLCYENFASLTHLPYILSVYKLSYARTKPSYKGYTGPKIKGILDLVCNKNNFSGIFLIKLYYLKHCLGFTVALAFFIATEIMFIQLWPDYDASDSFRCDVAQHEDKCMICVVHRKLDTMALFASAIALNLFCMIMSLSQIIWVRTCYKRANARYFDEIADTNSVALKFEESFPDEDEHDEVSEK